MTIMKTYQRIAAYVTLAGALSGCEKNNGDQIAPSPLESTVVQASVVKPEQELDLSTPEKTITQFFNAIIRRDKSTYFSTLSESFTDPFDEFKNLDRYTIKTVEG